MNNLEDFKFVKGFGGGSPNNPPPPTPAYEDAEGFLYNDTVDNVYQFARVTDLLSEGPIEGLCEGEYQFKGNAGDLGYTGVYYNEYPLAIGNQNTQVKYLRSIQWNQNPLVDSQNKYNYQQININVSKGGPRGIANIEDTDSTSYIRSIGERLRGPNETAVTASQISDFQKNYRIVNKECRKIKINFKIGSLYRTLKYQDLAASIKDDPDILKTDKTFNTFTLIGRGRSETGKDVIAGVGSVIRYNFDVHIKIVPVYRTYSNTSTEIDITDASKATSVVNQENLLLKPDTTESLYKINFNGKVTQGYLKQVAIDLTNIFKNLSNNDNWVGWDITVLKTTPEGITSSKSAYISIESLTEIYYSNFRYPNAAVASANFNAEYFSRIPDRNYDVNLLKVKVPSNYDPITKTYGNEIPLTIEEKVTINSSSNSQSQNFFSAVGNTDYTNTDDQTPPITNGLIGRFDATNASPNGSITSWPNNGSDASIKCIIGGGTYASPAGANGPTKGAGNSETSPNGKYGVTFTTSQNVRFTYEDPKKTFDGPNGDYTVFYVAKIHDFALHNERKMILHSSNAENQVILGFFDNYNKAFWFGTWINSNETTNTARGNDINEYTLNEKDSNCYIVGASVRTKSKSVDTYWQNTNFSTTDLTFTYAPQGLAVNRSGTIYANQKSKCTLFELLIFNRSLTKSECFSIRNWLNKKWNVLATTTFDNTKKVLVLDSSSVNIPLKTICRNGQGATTSIRGVAKDSTQDYQNAYYAGIPQRQRNLTSKWNLANQGFCSFYSDCSINLKNTIADGNYSLMQRDDQFNLSLQVTGETLYLILTLINKETSQKFQIKKKLKATASEFKEIYPRRITAYILPKVLQQNAKYNKTWYQNHRQYGHLGNVDSLISKGPASMGLYFEGGWPDLVKAAETKGFIEEVSLSTDSNLNPLINTYIKDNRLYNNYIKFPAKEINSGGQKQGALYDSIFLYESSNPTILNSQFIVLLDFKEEIICDLNVANHINYIQFLNASSILSNEESVSYGWDEKKQSSVNQVELDKVNNSANYHGVFSVNSNANNTINLTDTQNKVLLPISSFKNLYGNGNKFTPFEFIDSNKPIKLFTDESAKQYGGKIQGSCSSISVDSINFDVASLELATSKALFSSDKYSVQKILIPNGVSKYSLSNDMWDGEFKTEKQWTDNPAWCFYDLLTNKRYGAGNYVNESSVDKWSLYQIGKYCDELVSDGFGGIEPRFTCNVYIQSQEEALKVLGDMASVFRGMFYYANGAIYSTNDMPQNTPVYCFTNSNVVDGNFNYESTSLKDRNTSVYVRYIDKNNLYKPGIEYVENVEAVRKHGFKETEITAFGCTSRGQAQRLGRWVLASEYNETETVSFETGPEAVMFKPGDVIKIYDYNKKYKTVGGRLNAISFSGLEANTTTGFLTLDRKLDFNFQNSAKYELSIVSPKYILDPGTSGAITGSIDFAEFRKSLTNSFIIGSGDLITGQNYDTIRLTGLNSFLNTGLNISGLLPYTGGTGYAPASIIWNLGNSGSLDGTTDGDYDFYRIFRVQEASQSDNYTVLAAQMYNLKFTQIESGLNLTPSRAPSPPASAPDQVIFDFQSYAKDSESCKKDILNIDIYYNSDIKTATIGFRIFIKPEYNSSFDPNIDTNFIFTPVDLEKSFVTSSIDATNRNGIIRVYGVNINNECSPTYSTAKYRGDSTITNVGYFKELTNCIVNVSNFEDEVISYTRKDFFNGLSIQNPLPSDLQIGTDLKFIDNQIYPNKYYPYRIKIIPEKVDNKASFAAAYQKYVDQTDYLYEEEKSSQGEVYLFSHQATNRKIRNFSIAIDKFNSYNLSSTSKNFKDPKGFRLVTYDSLDNDLKQTLDNLLNNSEFKLTRDAADVILNFNMELKMTNFVSNLYLLLIPVTEIFDFSVNQIVYDDNNNPKSIKDKNNKEIIDSHFINIDNQPEVFYFNNQVDTIGKPFTLFAYKPYLIAVDLFMNLWQSSSSSMPDGVSITKNILNYDSPILNSNGSQKLSYAVISSVNKEIKIPEEIIVEDKSLQGKILKAGINYIHLTLNNSVLIEGIFDNPTNNQSTSIPNSYKLTRRNVLYKPTTDEHVQVKDDRVSSSDEEGAYYALSIANRKIQYNHQSSGNNFNNLRIIPFNFRAYTLLGNKIFTSLLAGIKTIANLLNGIFPENSQTNAVQHLDIKVNRKFTASPQAICLADLHIIKDYDLSGDNAGNLITTETSEIKEYLINNATCSSEQSAKNLIKDYESNLSDGFNLFNVTPDENFGSPDKDLNYPIPPTFQKQYLNYTITNPRQTNYIAALSSSEITNRTSLTNNSSYYPGVPLINDYLFSLVINIPYQGDVYGASFLDNKSLEVFVYHGEELISSTTTQTVIGSLGSIDIPSWREIVILIPRITPKNYYTYKRTYENGDVIINPELWSFNDVKNLSFAHLSARKQLGFFPEHNFYIQTMELSILITY